MEIKEKTLITVQANIHVPLENAWQLWTKPEHIIHWNNASEDWCSPRAENDLKVGGKFLFRMEARDGSIGFDFEGIYENVKPNELIEYVMADGRKAKITFTGDGDETTIVESFDAENVNSIELQRGGWQAILNNFKKYAEGIL